MKIGDVEFDVTPLKNPDGKDLDFGARLSPVEGGEITNIRGFVQSNVMQITSLLIEKGCIVLDRARAGVTSLFSSLPSEIDASRQGRVSHWHTDNNDINFLGVEAGKAPRIVPTEVARAQDVANVYREILASQRVGRALASDIARNCPRRDRAKIETNFDMVHELLSQVARSVRASGVTFEQVHDFLDLADAQLNGNIYSHAWDAPQNIDSVLLMAGNCLGEHFAGRFVHRQARFPFESLPESLGSQLRFGEFIMTPEERDDLECVY